MTLILLRGLTREARHWGQFADVLAARLAAAGLCRQAIVAIDLPGSGTFAHLKSPSDVR